MVAPSWHGSHNSWAAACLVCSCWMMHQIAWVLRARVCLRAMAPGMMMEADSVEALSHGLTVVPFLSGTKTHPSHTSITTPRHTCRTHRREVYGLAIGCSRRHTRSESHDNARSHRSRMPGGGCLPTRGYCEATRLGRELVVCVLCR